MKDSYGEYTDEELIVLLRDGENDITDYIMEKYKGMVKAKAKSMYLLGGDSDDLIQEGMIGLFKAIRDYDSGSYRRAARDWVEKFTRLPFKEDSFLQFAE